MGNQARLSSPLTKGCCPSHCRVTAAATWTAITAPRCKPSGGQSCANQRLCHRPHLSSRPRWRVVAFIGPRRDRPATGRTRDFSLAPQSGGRPHHAVAASWTNDLDFGGVLQGIIGHEVSSSTQSAYHYLEPAAKRGRISESRSAMDDTVGHDTGRRQSRRCLMR